MGWKNSESGYSSAWGEISSPKKVEKKPYKVRVTDMCGFEQFAEFRTEEEREAFVKERFKLVEVLQVEEQNGIVILTIPPQWDE